MSEIYPANRAGKGTQYPRYRVKEWIADANELNNASFVKRFCDIGYFLRAIRIQAKFGRLSRAPLRLLRLEFREDGVECDWLARPPDPWDADIPSAVRDRNTSAQAIEDAMAVRELLFSALPDVDSALLRAFRALADGEPELIIAGTVVKGQAAERNIVSLAMRAKLCGLRFCLDDGVLGALRTEDHAMSF